MRPARCTRKTFFSGSVVWDNILFESTLKRVDEKIGESRLFLDFLGEPCMIYTTETTDLHKGKRMFRKNTSHLQSSLFGIASQLPKAKLKKLKKSKEYDFYRLIFCHINEADFSVLYSDHSSRPNAPVNSLVSSVNYNLSQRQLFFPFS